MATLIICPACQTRYEIKAAFPPEGRKVRCAKCSHVWMAKPAGAEAVAPAPQAAPAPQPAPTPQAKAPPPAPTPPAPPPPQAAPQPAAPTPAAPVPPVTPAPPAAPPQPAAPQAAPPLPPPQPVPAPPPPAAPQAAPPPPDAGLAGLPPAQRSDAEYEAEDDALAAQMARMRAESAPPPPPEPTPTVAKQGGLFAKIMGKRGKQPAEPPEDVAPPPPPEMAPPPDASFGESPPPGAPAEADASFDAGFEGDETDPALADPDLVAAAFGEAPPKDKTKAPRKALPVVAIGWGILALLVAIVVGLFAFAPNTTVSILPGAAKVYSLFGMPVGSDGLAFEGVRYGWTNDGSQTVLEVQGNVKNTSSATMTVPTVVIALRDENGEEISEWTTEVGAAELSAGEEAPFLRQIPSPPSNVRSLKVRFAKAE